MSMTEFDHNTAHSEDDGFSEITRILSSLEKGENHTEALIPLVYNQLRRIAVNRLSGEPSGQTLQATALVHETYLRLIKTEGAVWENRRHFFGAATEAMRRILIENARSKKSLKRGGSVNKCDTDPDNLCANPVPVDILDLDEALTELEKLDPQAAELVQLRYFVGLTMKQISGILEISERMAANIWAFAQAWLYRRLNQ